jgi:hypothetical protein
MDLIMLRMDLMLIGKRNIIQQEQLMTSNLIGIKTKKENILIE